MSREPSPRPAASESTSDPSSPIRSDAEKEPGPPPPRTRHVPPDSLAERIEGVAVRRLREGLGLTQQELASQTGYSTRLIRKVESGKSISPETAADLWTFFNEAAPDRADEILRDEPMETVRGLIEGYHRAGIAVLDPYGGSFHDDFIFINPGDPADCPLAGTFAGVDGFRDWLTRAESMFVRDPESFRAEYFTNGDDIIAAVTESYHVGGDLLADVKLFLRFTFGEGRITRLVNHHDTSPAAAALARASADD